MQSAKCRSNVTIIMFFQLFRNVGLTLTIIFVFSFWWHVVMWLRWHLVMWLRWRLVMWLRWHLVMWPRWHLVMWPPMTSRHVAPKSRSSFVTGDRLAISFRVDDRVFQRRLQGRWGDDLDKFTFIFSSEIFTCILTFSTNKFLFCTSIYM